LEHAANESFATRQSKRIKVHALATRKKKTV
jgi:hypothetical protein